MSLASVLKKHYDALPPAERKKRSEFTERIAVLVAQDKLVDAAMLIDLQLAAEKGEPTLEELRRENAKRVKADHQRIIAGSYRVDELTAGMGVTRQRLHQLVHGGELVAAQLRPRGRRLFPMWQFVPGTFAPLRGLSEVIAAARQSRFGSYSFYFFMTEPNEYLRDRSPAAVLRDGDVDAVINVILAAGIR